MTINIVRNRGVLPVSKAVAAALLTGLAQYAVGRATVLSRGPALADSGYYVKSIGEIAAMIAICIASFAVGCWLLQVRAWFAVALAMFLAEAILAGEAWHLLPQLGTGRFVIIAVILAVEYLVVMPLRRRRLAGTTPGAD